MSERWGKALNGSNLHRWRFLKSVCVALLNPSQCQSKHDIPIKSLKWFETFSHHFLFLFMIPLECVGEQKQEFCCQFAKMETPPRLENCAPSPEPVLEGTSAYLEEARVSKLKLLENNTCVICYSTVQDGQKSFPSCCLHIFCFDCLCKWSQQKNQCPLCKKGKITRPRCLANCLVNFLDLFSKTNMEPQIEFYFPFAPFQFST